MNKIVRNNIKNNAQRFLSVCLLLSMVAGWWGVLYPQLTLNSDTYRVVTETGEEVAFGEESSEKNSAAIYLEMLNADRSRFRFRFRFVEEIMKYLGYAERQ